MYCSVGCVQVITHTKIMTKLQNFKNHVIWRQKCYNTHRSLSKHFTISIAQTQTCCNYCWTGSACNSKADIRSSWLNTSGLRLFASSQRLKIESGQRGCQRVQQWSLKAFLQFVFKRHKLNGPHGPQKIWERSWQISFQSDACNGHTALFTSTGDCKQNSEENRKECLSQD